MTPIVAILEEVARASGNNVALGGKRKGFWGLCLATVSRAGGSGALFVDKVYLSTYIDLVRGSVGLASGWVASDGSREDRSKEGNDDDDIATPSKSNDNNEITTQI